ncbi:MAG: aminotransferase class V-fold PLP-dependent enzyme [Candidatus Aenigmatarchaeota archaeon]
MEACSYGNFNNFRMNVNKIREDFPVLKRKIKDKEIIYFDNACTTLKPYKVIEAITYYYENLSVCGGSRSSHDLSIETNELCIDAREKAKAFINAENSKEIIWTKNTTEGINLIANSLKFKKDENVVCSNLDHHSGILPFCKLYMRNKIKELRIVEANNDGTFNLEYWKEAIDSKTRIVSVIGISNVTGTLSPIKEIAEIAHDNNALILVDGAQLVPHKKVDVQKLDVDFLAFSMHKLCGPTGIGVLYGKQDLLEEMDTFIVGGDTILDVEYFNKKIKPIFLSSPQKFEAGVQNYSGIIGSGAAFDYIQKIGMDNINNYEKKLTENFLKFLDNIDDIELVGPLYYRKRECCLISFSLKNKNISPKDLADFMNNEIYSYKIMLRAGGHCAHPFHYFIGINLAKGEGTVRASLYFYNTIREIEIFIEALKKFLDIVSK